MCCKTTIPAVMWEIFGLSCARYQGSALYLSGLSFPTMYESYLAQYFTHTDDPAAKVFKRKDPNSLISAMIRDYLLPFDADNRFLMRSSVFVRHVSVSVQNEHQCQLCSLITANDCLFRLHLLDKITLIFCSNLSFKISYYNRAATTTESSTILQLTITLAWILCQKMWTVTDWAPTCEKMVNNTAFGRESSQKRERMMNEEFSAFHQPLLIVFEFFKRRRSRFGIIFNCISIFVVSNLRRHKQMPGPAS